MDLASEKPGTWPKRFPDVHAHNDMEPEGPAEATYTLNQPFKQMQEL